MISRLDIATGIINSYLVSEPGDQLSGITCFDYQGSPAIAVTTYDDVHIHFYEDVGTGVSFIGSGQLPAGVSTSYGLTYNEFSDTFYWSYKGDDSKHYISELGYTEVSLQQTTFGAIKSILGSQ
ncbi:hypothetical protein GF394_04170 [Candidatus Fermentibacteria bacterium]|nr:hypothetical protein [Candidatus Fermentibacteria bacterium]